MRHRAGGGAEEDGEGEEKQGATRGSIPGS